MNLTPEQKSRLVIFTSSRDWQLVNLIADELVRKINDDELIKDTEFETIKAVFAKDYQVRGIKRLLNEIYNSIQ
jgi:hypothetical protein